MRQSLLIRLFAILFAALSLQVAAAQSVPDAAMTNTQKNWNKDVPLQSQCLYDSSGAFHLGLVCKSDVNKWSYPGWSIGNPGVGGQGWFGTAAYRLDDTSWSAGIGNGFLIFPTKYAIGDFNPHSIYSTVKNATTAPSDEGAVITRVHLYEEGTPYDVGRLSPMFGLVNCAQAGGCRGATELSIACPGNCNTVGVGHPLIDKSAVAYGSITEVHPAPFISTATVTGLPVSASNCATTTAPIETPTQPINLKSPQPQTISLTITSPFHQGDLITIARPFIENTVVSSADAPNGTSQTITAPLAYPYHANALVCTGGLAGGYYLEQTSFTFAQGTTLPPTKITAWSAADGIATFTADNGLRPGQTLQLSGFGATTALNGQRGTVLAAGLTNKQFSLKVSGVNGSATENGLATPGTRYLFPIIGSQTGGSQTSGQAGGPSATLYFLASGSIFPGPAAIYPGATVVNSGNSSSFAGYNSTGTLTLNLDRNGAPWNAGDAVENASLFNATYVVESNFLGTQNPFARVTVSDTNIAGATLASPEGQILTAGYNVSSLRTHGGGLSPAVGTHLKDGPFAAALVMDNAPEGGFSMVSGGAFRPCVLCVGGFAPGSSVSTYDIFFDSAVGGRIDYSPAGDLGSGLFEFHPGTAGVKIDGLLRMEGAVDMGSHPLINLRNGASASDAATLGQLPVATSWSTTGHSPDTIPVRGMTSAGHCSLGPTNASAAANVTTTYISAKAPEAIALTYSGPAGMRYDILCTSY